MKKTIIYLLVFTFIIAAAAGNLTAQDFKGATIKYKQTKKYDFDKVFNPRGVAGPRMTNWLATLPKKTEHVKVLYLTEEKALYQKSTDKEEAVNVRGLQRALMGMAMRKPPEPSLEKVYYDFGNIERTRQMEFMTRYFLVTGKIEKIAWKMGSKRVKILDYTCSSAELKQGENTITAYYTPEIPVSAGPDEFHGLPGLILAIEVNGEYIYIAMSVDLNTPEEGLLSKPDKGDKVSKDEFSRTVDEKVEEWKKNPPKRRGKR